MIRLDKVSKTFVTAERTQSFGVLHDVLGPERLSPHKAGNYRLACTL